MSNDYGPGTALGLRVPGGGKETHLFSYGTYLLTIKIDDKQNKILWIVLDRRTT